VSGGRWSATSGPAGGRELLGGSPLVNAAFRVFPKQAIFEIEACTSDAALRISGQSSTISTRSLHSSTQARVARNLVNFSCRRVASFRQRESSIHSEMPYTWAYWLMGQPMGINEPFRIANTGHIVSRGIVLGALLGIG
jgi:hypothetical protein